MKILIVLLNLFLIQNISNSQWFEQNSGTAESLNWIDFTDVNTGIACGYNGMIVRTTNGGTNWNPVTSNVNVSLKYVYFKNSSTGFILCYPLYNTMLTTTNYGVTWSVVTLSLTKEANDIIFLNENTGFIAGDGGLLLRTTNGGLNWFTDPLTINGTPVINRSCRISTNRIIWAGYETNGSNPDTYALWQTTDGGSSYSGFQYFGLGHFNAVSFGSQSNGIVGGGGYVGITNNGGINWSVPATGTYLATDCFSHTTAYTVYRTHGWIQYSSDNGVNWSVQYDVPGKTVTSIKMVNTQTGYASGSNGLILKTTNGGIIGINPVSSEVPEKYYLYQNYPNPFNPSTKISFSIPLSKEVPERRGVFVKLVIYNSLGQEVAILVNERLQPGTYEVEWNAADYPSGVYFYALNSERFTESKKMLMIK